MNEVVHNEVCILAKGFATLDTFIGFLPTMDLLVSSEVWWAGKGLPTLYILIGLLSSMDTKVANKVSVPKGFPAFFVLKGFSPVWALLCKMKVE